MPVQTFRIALALAAVLFTGLLIGCGDDASNNDAAQSKTNPAIAAQIPDYPLESCVVSGVTLGDHGKPHDVLYEDQLVRFCCAKCLSGFNDDPAGYVAKIKQAPADDPSSP